MLRLEVVPCPACWDTMRGDAERRHCADCERDVHDLSMRTEPEALALLERGECIRYRTDERGAVRLAAQSFCVAAITLGACTPTGRADVLAVDPVEEIEVGFLIDHDLQSIERLTREIIVEGHVGCEDGGCVMGGLAPLKSISWTAGIPVAVAVVADPPVVQPEAPVSRPRRTEASRAAKRADRWKRKRLHRAARRADRKAHRAARRFARAHRFVAKLRVRSFRG